MKKLLAIVSTLILVLTLAACGGSTAAPAFAGVAEGGSIQTKVDSAEIDLSSISAKDSDGNELDIRVTGLFDLTSEGEYSIKLSATDADGNKTELNVTLEVVALTCEEDPEQEACKTDVDRAQEEYEALGIYNVDLNNNGTADWMEDTIELTVGYSYYGAEDETNSVWMNIEKFMEDHPNITVTRDPLYSSGWENGDDGLLLIQEQAANEGTLPDVFFNPKAAETYDRGMTLDLTPYLDTDEEAQMITPNALAGMRTYDNKEIWGIPWQGVGPMTAVNVSLLDYLGIDAPDYDWTYEEYEALRDEIGLVSDTGACVFPGIIDLSIEGPRYFDAVPNGYKGYNIETQRFDFADAVNYGDWLASIAAEAKLGWHFYDLDDATRETRCPDIVDSWTDGVRAINTIYLWSFNDYVNTMASKGFEIDIYPFPVAPEGGVTETYIYHDYYSVSGALEEDRVKAEAAYQLIKWITFGEDGLEARWSLIDELNEEYGDMDLEKEGFQSAFTTGDLYLMDYIQGWPITSNPNVLELHPLVKGFSVESGLSRYNFDAFKLEAFQYQLSNANPYPRQIPAFASVANDFFPFEAIKDRMRDESLNFVDIAPGLQEDMNDAIAEYLQNYIGSVD
jgi:multiple sugar transport system substrate-binding protein